jgi:hypothetical protein
MIIISIYDYFVKSYLGKYLSITIPFCAVLVLPLFPLEPAPTALPPPVPTPPEFTAPPPGE